MPKGKAPKGKDYVVRDMALELGPPSGTGKLIPLLLDAGTSSCTRLPFSLLSSTTGRNMQI